MKQHRIYIVGTGGIIRLVRATHRAKALAHVARSTINVSVATQDELVEALGRGIKVEAVTETDSAELFEGHDHAAPAQ